MILSHRRRFIFLKTRKVASSSVELALSPLCGPEDIITPLEEEAQRAGGPGAQNYVLPFRRWPIAGKVRRLIGTRLSSRRTGYYPHISAREVRKFAGEEVFDSYFKFSIERNPWDRQVSMYFWATKSLPERPSFFDYMHSQSKFKHVGNWQIYTINNRIAADMVIQYDDLQAGLDAALARIGVAPHEAPRLPQAKADVRPKRPYQDFYDDTTRQMVSDWYGEEIDAFGYTFWPRSAPLRRASAA